jgi:hypothetical protein
MWQVKNEAREKCALFGLALLFELSLLFIALLFRAGIII